MANEHETTHAIIVFTDIRPLSKQFSWQIAGRRMILKQAFKKRRDEFHFEALRQLRDQRWAFASKENVHLSIVIKWPFVLGDDENIVGIILDALQGAAYVDDCQARLTGGIYTCLGDAKVVMVQLDRGSEDEYVKRAMSARGKIQGRKKA